MQAEIYLFFDGSCEEALTFYAATFGAKIESMSRYGDAPEAARPPGVAPEKIMHARLRVGGTAVMASDAPSRSYNKPQGLAVSLGVDSPAEAERVFQAMAQGGTVTMAMQQTFFATKFGMLTDRFGIPWMIVGGAAG